MNQPTWPDDLQRAFTFHGHMCPGLAIGYRVARAALSHLQMAHAPDEEVVAVVENDSCAVDAVQVLCGCTFGKGNLIFRDHGKQVYTFFTRPSGEAVRISLRPLPSEGDESLDPVEARSLRIRQILSAPEGDLLAVTKADEHLPDAARIHESAPCDECGEATMVTRFREVSGRRLCIPCAKRHPIRPE